MQIGDGHLFASLHRAWREFRSEHFARRAQPSGEFRMTREVRERLAPVSDDEPAEGQVGTLFGLPVVVDSTIPASPGFEIRHRHRWSEWECAVLTGDFPMRRFCLAGGDCWEQQMWLKGEPEPTP